MTEYNTDEVRMLAVLTARYAVKIARDYGHSFVFWADFLEAHKSDIESRIATALDDGVSRVDIPIRIAREMFHSLPKWEPLIVLSR